MQDSTLVIGSMDMETLCPSCKAKGIGMSVRALAMKSKLFWNANMRIVVRYLCLTVGSTNSRLNNFIPKAKGTTLLSPSLSVTMEPSFMTPVKHHDEAYGREKRELHG